MKNIYMFLKKLVQIGTENFFMVQKGDTLLCKVPLLVPVLCAIPFFWMLMLLLALGLAAGCEYFCSGPCFQKQQKPDQQQNQDTCYADLLQQKMHENS